MTLEYTWARDNLKQKLYKKRIKTNVIYIVLSILLFFYITYYGFVYKEFDNLWLIVGFIIYIAFISLLLFITTKLYVNNKLKHNDLKTNNAYGLYKLTINEQSISVEYNNSNISYKWCDISKIIITDKKIFLRTKNDKIGLTFYKNLFRINEYNELLSNIKEHIKK